MISSNQSKITRLENTLAGLRKKDAEEAKKEAGFNVAVNKATAEAAKSKSASSVTSKLKQAETARKNAATAAAKRAGYARDLASTNAELMRTRTSLAKDEEKQRVKFSKDIDRQQTRQIDRQRSIQDLAVAGMKASRISARPTSEATSESFDVFISHASEDKEDFVRELATKASMAGLKVFYDEMTLKWGDSLRGKIDYGLANSRFGVVVLSESFFKKEWPKRELDGLFGMEIERKSLILPIWHKISKDEVMKLSPTLGGKLELNTASLSVEEIVEKLVEIVRG